MPRVGSMSCATESTAIDEDLLILVQGSVLDSEEGIRFRGYTVCIIRFSLVGEHHILMVT